MAVIQQGNTYKTVIGWYGDCDDECQDLNLSAYKSQLTAVYQWDNGGALKVWKSNLPDALNRSFKSLECGKIYYLYVKPGTGSFTVPNFVVSSYETQDAGRVAAHVNRLLLHKMEVHLHRFLVIVHQVIIQ